MNANDVKSELLACPFKGNDKKANDQACKFGSTTTPLSDHDDQTFYVSYNSQEKDMTKVVHQCPVTQEIVSPPLLTGKIKMR